MSEEIKIEKGIPISSSPPSSIWSLFKSMEIGDSFIVNNGEDANRARSCAYNHNMRAVCRRQPDGTYRIWRKS